jgi:uncharacterized protein (TIGR02246 family)
MRAVMKTTVLLAFFACRLWCQAIHQPPSPEIDVKSQILDTDAQYRSAVLRGDAAKLAIIFADDILIVHSDGGTDSKANFLDAISSGRLKLTSYERSDVQVRTYGSTALMLSKTAKTFAYRGKPGKAHDTSIVTFSKMGKEWKIVAMQNTPLSD